MSDETELAPSAYRLLRDERMKRSLLMIPLMAGVMAAALAIPAAAPRALATDRSIANLQDYLAGHPEAAAELRTDPQMIDDPRFIAQHPELRSYLAGHPTVSIEFKAHPYRFMKRVESD